MRAVQPHGEGCGKDLAPSSLCGALSAGAASAAMLGAMIAMIAMHRD